VGGGFDRKLGIELTEWLDKRQTTPSISTTENEINALDSENSPPPEHFQSAHLWFRKPKVGKTGTEGD
jgi:hypothetical protein